MTNLCDDEQYFLSYLYICTFVLLFADIPASIDNSIKLVRKLDKNSIGYLKDNISLMDWENIMNETDVDKSYDMFLDVFTNMIV